MTPIRTIAKEGALAALAASKPGAAARQRDYELEAAKGENAQLSEALKEMAVRLTLVEGKESWGQLTRILRATWPVTLLG